MNGESVLLRAALAFLPVLLFLTALMLLDSFRLVRPRRLASGVGAGVAAALGCYYVNSLLIDLIEISNFRYAILVAPVVEEGAKAAYVGWLIRTRRVGFLVDAAILGFAAGTGFALVENLYYLKNLSTAPWLVWIVRGLGTALMHGGATALLALVVQGFGRRVSEDSARPWLVAFMVAVVLHGAYNRFMVHPLYATGTTIVVLPTVLWLAYHLGERRLRRWLGYGFDRDSELLALITSGQVTQSPLGRYLRSLRESFRPDTVTDMLCLLRLQCELNLRAKGTLLLREHSLRPHPDPDLSAKLAEARWLEQSVGQTGLLALRPVCRWRGTDAWQRHLLEDETPA